MRASILLLMLLPGCGDEGLGGAFGFVLTADGLQARGGFASSGGALGEAGQALLDGFPELAHGDCARFDGSWASFDEEDQGRDGGALEVGLPGGTLRLEPGEILGEVYYAGEAEAGWYGAGSWPVSGEGKGRIRSFSDEIEAPPALEGMDLAPISTEAAWPLSWTPAGDPVWVALSRAPEIDPDHASLRWVCRLGDTGTAEIPADVLADFADAPASGEIDAVEVLRFRAGTIAVRGLRGPVLWTVKSVVSGAFAR